MFKKFLLTIILYYLTSGSLHANSYSIFGGTYDYDDDNTTNLIGLNYHISNSEIDLLSILTINPVVGGLVTAKSASMFYGGFETNLGSDLIYLNLSSSADLFLKGVDLQTLKKDMDSQEVKNFLSIHKSYVDEFKITGSPATIIGNQIIPGFIDQRKIIEILEKEFS